MQFYDGSCDQLLLQSIIVYYFRMTRHYADKYRPIISHLKSIYSSRVNRFDEIGSRV